MRDRNGWDGKLRVGDDANSDRRAVLANPEALEDPDYSDEDAPPVEEINADEGTSSPLRSVWTLNEWLLTVPACLSRSS